MAAILDAMSSLRLPQGAGRRFETGLDALTAEMLSEQGASLGRAGQKLETAMAALKAHDAGDLAGERDPLVKAAAYAAWCYFIQREACGIRDQKPAIAHYGIPREVLLRMGAA